MATNDATFFADSKLRRETSNFKINFVAGRSIPDPNSKNPTEPIVGLMQILPKNLSPEDFIGVVGKYGPDSGYGGPSIQYSEISSVTVPIDDSHPVSYQFFAGSGRYRYWPSTGYLTGDGYTPPTINSDEGSEGGNA